MADRLPIGEVTGLVLAHHHQLAKGVLLSLLERGIRWPDDLSVVLIGTPEWHDLLRPSLACVQRPEEEMGRAAASLLLEKVYDPHHSEAGIMFPTTFVEGGSIARIPVSEGASGWQR
jgi:LacI family transcriptional regulator